MTSSYMAQLLDFRRLFYLLSKHWFENRKTYGLFFVSTLAFLLGWFAFILMIGNPYSFGPTNQAILYFAGLFIAGCLSASFLLRDFASKPGKINFHLLPAATFEKLLCILFFGVLLFFIGYTLLFYITDYFAVKMANNATAAMMASRTAKAMEWKQRFGLTEQPFGPVSVVNMFSPGPDTFVFYPGDNIDLFSAFFPMQSAFILGSVYFKRNGFFKTVVVLLLIWLLFFSLEDKLLFPLLPGNARTSRMFTTSIVYDADGNETYYTLPFWIGSVANFLLKFCLTPALWVATYYRLKEKEI